MHDSDLTKAAAGAGFKIGGNQFAQVLRTKGVQIEFAGDGERNRFLALIGRRHV
jgi:hypothetical protein